jgi:hypothetical protein
LKTTLKRNFQQGGYGGSLDESIAKLILQVLPNIIGFLLQNLNVFMDILMALMSAGVIRLGGSRAKTMSRSMSKSRSRSRSMSKSRSRSASKFRQAQIGGAVKERLISGLAKLRVKLGDDPEAVACIDRLTNKFSAIPATPETTQDVSPSAPPVDPASLLTSEINNAPPPQAVSAPPNETLPQKIKRFIMTKVEGFKQKMSSKIESMFTSIKKKTGMDDEDIACLRTLKTKILSRITSDLITKIQENKLYNTFVNSREILGNVASASRDKAKEFFSAGLGFLGNAANSLKDRLGSSTSSVQEQPPATVPEQTPTTAPEQTPTPAPEQKQGLFQGLTSGFAGLRPKISLGWGK